jgi:putative tricarboxylic transport membrane protein
VPEILVVAEKAILKTKDAVSAIPPPTHPSDRSCTWAEFLRYWRTILRSSFIGAFIGALPGIGSAVAAFLAYGSAKRKSKEAHLFGKGAMEGVAAAESGNNAVCGAALIPLLTLGIPGDVVTAVLLGALMIHDLTPGPLLFQDKPDIVFALFVGLLIANLVLITVGSVIIQYSKFLTSVPGYLLFPVVIVFCVIGSYSIQNELFDVGIMLGFGMLGYIMRRFEFPAAPLLIAFLLGPMIENSLRQALIMSKTGWYIFLTRPISLVFLILTVISIVGIFLRRRRETH